MNNKKGISWKLHLPKVNLECYGEALEPGHEFKAIYYHEDGEKELIKVFNPQDYGEHSDMMKQLTLWNYGTCELCPIVKYAMDSQN